MATKTRYPRSWEWPGKAKIAISINLAFEAFVRRSQISLQKTPGEIDHFSLSYAEYGVRSGIWRLLDVLDEFGLKGSMSTNGLAAERHPEIIHACAEAGHEVVGHGWANDELVPGRQRSGRPSWRKSAASAKPSRMRAARGRSAGSGPGATDQRTRSIT